MMATVIIADWNDGALTVIDSQQSTEKENGTTCIEVAEEKQGYPSEFSRWVEYDDNYNDKTVSPNRIVMATSCVRNKWNKQSSPLLPPVIEEERKERKSTAP